MATGIVKWFNAEKGYGFIMPDDGSKDLLHIIPRSAARATNRCRRISAYPSRWDKGPGAKRQEHKVIA